MDPLFPLIPEDFASLDLAALAEYIAATEAACAHVADNHEQLAADEPGRYADILAEMRAAVDALDLARAELAARAETEEPPPPDEPPADEVDASLAASEILELAGRAAPPEPVETIEVAAVEPEPAAVAEPDGVTAALAASRVTTARPALPAPAASRRPAESRPQATLTASANSLGHEPGDEIDAREIARMMVERHRTLGRAAKGAFDKVPVARFSWSHLYDEDRKLGQDEIVNLGKINALLSPHALKGEMERRKKLSTDKALTASGGLCAPVTPYYELQMLATADRPVRAALAGFNAERGGIRFAAPASVADISTAVDVKTVANDFAGGTEATKTCQRIECPGWSEVDIQAISHCVEFGNIGARTFPELVQQWNDLVLAFQARVAETELLDGIGAASTAVTAGAEGMGATATLPSQILTAAAALRSRHRMRRDAILRVLLPAWALDLLTSDMYRTQFDRFDMSPEQFVQVLRQGNVEPSFYLDSETGKNQVFGAQNAGALLTFPSTVVWYIYPEGSFIFVDGGMLELGIVRDSVLNATNDFQIFGESFENVAFVGVESLKVTTTVCDSGTVSLPAAVTCPVGY